MLYIIYYILYIVYYTLYILYYMHILLVEGEGVRVVRELRSRCLCIYRGRLRAGAEDFEFAIDNLKPNPTKLIPTIIITTITNIINYILIIT